MLPATSEGRDAGLDVARSAVRRGRPLIGSAPAEVVSVRLDRLVSDDVIVEGGGEGLHVSVHHRLVDRSDDGCVRMLVHLVRCTAWFSDHDSTRAARRSRPALFAPSLGDVGPFVDHFEIGELRWTLEDVGHDRTGGRKPLGAARILLARASLLLALEHHRCGSDRVVLVTHHERPDQARSGLLSVSDLFDHLGGVLTRLQPHPDELCPHVPSPLRWHRVDGGS